MEYRIQQEWPLDGEIVSSRNGITRIFWICSTWEINLLWSISFEMYDNQSISYRSWSHTGVLCV